MLTQASKCARYLELVDPAAFVDRRNGEPQDNLDYYTEHLAQAQIYGGGEDDKLALPAFPELPQYSLYVSSPQRYHIEIWCEKSTMADILGGLARQYSAVYQDGMGELSITVALDAIRRFERSGKPVRIFYVSDFDPAGAGMPVSMSRKIEYFLHKLGLGLDVKLFPIVLTYAQVKYYNRILPTPIKESERRKDRFEARYGKGAVELDALEALYPGELARILRRAIGEYYDSSLERKVSEAQRRIEQQLIPVQSRIYADHDAEIAELRDLHAEIERLVEQQMEAFSTRKAELWQAIGHNHRWILRDDRIMHAPDMHAHLIAELEPQVCKPVAQAQIALGAHIKWVIRRRQGDEAGHWPL